MFTKGTYIGPREELREKTALVQPVAGSNYLIQAQFDDFSAQREGVCLAYGWHHFAVDDFKLEHVG